MSQKKQLIQKTFYVTEELDTAIGVRAAQDRIDKSALVREALAEYLKDTLKLLEEAELSEKQKEKREAWDVALGLMKIDVQPTEEFLQDVERETRGEISPEDMIKSWEKRHKVNSDEENPV